MEISIRIIARKGCGGHIIPQPFPSVDISEITRVLKKWKMPEEIIEHLHIEIETRDMIPEAVYQRIGDTRHRIYLSPSAFATQELLNRCIVHELKHLWYAVLKRKAPKMMCWEELTCARVENTYKNVNFLQL
jgi:hypothetical protein